MIYEPAKTDNFLPFPSFEDIDYQAERIANYLNRPTAQPKVFTLNSLEELYFIYAVILKLTETNALKVIGFDIVEVYKQIVRVQTWESLTVKQLSIQFELNFIKNDIGEWIVELVPQYRFNITNLEEEQLAWKFYSSILTQLGSFSSKEVLFDLSQYDVAKLTLCAQAIKNQRLLKQILADVEKFLADISFTDYARAKLVEIRQILTQKLTGDEQ